VTAPPWGGGPKSAPKHPLYKNKNENTTENPKLWAVGSRVTSSAVTGDASIMESQLMFKTCARSAKLAPNDPPLIGANLGVVRALRSAVLALYVRKLDGSKRFGPCTYRPCRRRHRRRRRRRRRCRCSRPRRAAVLTASSASSASSAPSASPASSASSASSAPSAPSASSASSEAPATAPPPRSPPTGYPRRLRPGPSLPPHPDIVDTRTPPPPTPSYLTQWGWFLGVGFPRHGAAPG